MTSAQIRQSYLDFFAEKGHTIVPSSSLLPESPGLLFTNAGMNQFVPIFLNETPCPYSPPRAANTQKCIRAGGKHNDLEDVGLDTYHHTLFEMLGNWSFGDYFKQEAITWAWELVVGRWKFPPQRLYATVYSPDKAQGDPADFDQEAYDIWAALFTQAGLDPRVHIVHGNKKDNFWMMGETGPCGPCSEIHIDLTPEPRTLELEKRGASLVNSSDARCMEIWNLVFIQFNANADGTFRPLPAKHVDTGMGFERVCSILQCTKNFTDFTRPISNYETDVFSPIFRKLEELSGKQYTSTLPKQGVVSLSDQERQDVAFRVIADHLRTLSLSVADGILPGNNGRNYVLRRILRRAVLWSRSLGLHEPFFHKLVPTVVDQLSSVFPALKTNQATIEKVLKAEEESFNRTLDNGIALFNEFLAQQGAARSIPGDIAFKLYDTYGFPLDMTELMARERGLTVDTASFQKLMQEQKERSQAAQKKETIAVADTDDSIPAAQFIGYDVTEAQIEFLTHKIEFGKSADDTVKARLFFSPTPFYAEMGGQVGDTGWLEFGGHRLEILDTQKVGRGIAHLTEDVALLDDLSLPARAVINLQRRALIEAHHSATHLLHWALREVLGPTVGQKGSYVGPDRLRFDFSHLEAMKPEQIAQVEAMVNNKIAANVPVKWYERPYAEVKGDSSILQFFGDKYGEIVRVVDIGGFSKELCAGTHVKETGMIGVFRIVGESAIAAGIRRIEALCGSAINTHLESVFAKQQEEAKSLTAKSGKVIPLQGLSPDPAKSWSAYLSNQSEISHQKSAIAEAEKASAKAKQTELQKLAASLTPSLLTEAEGTRLFKNLGDADPALLPYLAGELKRSFQGVAVLACTQPGKATLLALVTDGSANAGQIIKEIAPLVGGKGGGKPDLAQGGGTNPAALPTALEAAKAFLTR